jgi:hypothetical protein
LPGPDLAVDDPAWALMDGVDEIESGQVAEGCARLERIDMVQRAHGSNDVSKVEGLEAAVNKCVDGHIDSAVKLIAEWERRERLNEIKERRGLFAPNEEQVKRIDEALAKLPGVTDDSALASDLERLGEKGVASKVAQIKTGKVVVSGPLPKEVVRRIVAQSYTRFRACYEAGLDRDPTLAGTVTLRFVIGRNGAATSISTYGDLKDAKATTCISKAVYELTFPEPDGGIVTVSYPLELIPPAGKYQIKPAPGSE